MKATQGSASEDSYAENSWVQNYNFHAVAKPRLADAIKYLVCKTLRGRRPVIVSGNGGVVPARHYIAIADLGCSHGRNTLHCADFVLGALHENCSTEHMEIQYFFSDLPSNDFNALFQSLQPYLHRSGSSITDHPEHPLPKIFAAGVPGSFYGRLFPSASLDLVICSYSLHWLSQIPPSLVDKASSAWNGGQTWVYSKAKPSNNVVDAYSGQSQIDLKNFLKSRAHEVMSGGIVFLFSIARSTPDREAQLANDIVSFDTTFDVFDNAWKELVDEGLITLEEMEMFNVPIYIFNQQELEAALKNVPELGVLDMETIKNMAFFPEQGDRMQTVEQWVRMLSSTLKPTVEAYMGKTKANALFKKLKSMQDDCFNSRLTHDLVIASLVRL